MIGVCRRGEANNIYYEGTPNESTQDEKPLSRMTGDGGGYLNMYIQVGKRAGSGGASSISGHRMLPRSTRSDS